MAILNRLFQNFSQLTTKATAPVVGRSNTEVGLTELSYSGMPPDERQAVYPNWFFSSKLGQPRGVDIRMIRNFAQSPWTQMVLGTFKRQIATIPYEIVPEDEEDDIDYSEKIKIAEDFFNNVNNNNQSVSDINSEVITDIGEIDAGVFNYVYTSDSYVIGDLPVYDSWGRIVNTEPGLVLKPLGQRTLAQIKSVDGGTMLKQVDIYKNLLNYYQYSFKHPKQNPTRFLPEEIGYMIMNSRPYSVYGFSPVQSIQQVLEVLIQGTRYNKDLYKNNAVPDILLSIPKLPKDQLKKLKRTWNNNYKGKPHQVGFINWAIEDMYKLAESNRDLEWLNGQQWYFKIVFGVFGVSPTEAGFFENANKSNDEGQARVTVRNALKPYMHLLENMHTKRTLTEIFQDENHGLKFKFCPKDQVNEQIEFEQNMQEIDHGALTINEYRKAKGKEPVEWGDENPKQSSNPMGDMFGNQPNNQEVNQRNEKFKKRFVGFMNDSKQSTHS